MKNLPQNLLNHLKQEVITLAYGLRFFLPHNQEISLTTHTHDLKIGNKLCKACPGLSLSSFSSHMNLAHDLIEVELIDPLTYLPLNHLSTLEGANLDIVLVNYENPQDFALIKRGFVHKMKEQGRVVTLEVRGLTSLLDQSIQEIYSPECRAQFCDKRCGLNLKNYTYKGVVTESDSQNIYTRFQDTNRTENKNILASSTLYWVSGKNKGETSYVRSYDETNKQFLLWAPLKAPMENEDAYELTLGCDKSLGTCANFYKNAVNFRGEPFVPNQEKIRRKHRG
jgi:uncharacterized phage protein (TIGR02218 family)